MGQYVCFGCGLTYQHQHLRPYRKWYNFDKFYYDTYACPKKGCFNTLIEIDDTLVHLVLKFNRELHLRTLYCCSGHAGDYQPYIMFMIDQEDIEVIEKFLIDYPKFQREIEPLIQDDIDRGFNATVFKRVTITPPLLLTDSPTVPEAIHQTMRFVMFLEKFANHMVQYRNEKPKHLPLPDPFVVSRQLSAKCIKDLTTTYYF